MKNKNNILWKKANKVIMGGNSLFSKRPENFLPNYWPAYYMKAKGCYIWDLDNKKYIDMSLMGVGTNLLGYANKQVDDAVIKNIKNSNMSTLNCPEEVKLANKLLEIHPWAYNVKFARTGAEANSIAVRIARVHTKKTQIAICGYHGWHDWYLSANLNKNNNLKKFLMDGLGKEGIPKELSKTVYTFEYNNIKKLEWLLKIKKIKIIKMEVMRNISPIDNFLKKVRKLANKHNALLIFDECTTGFRETFGGLHKKYKIIPDLVTFGKAIGNGHAITAVLGKKNVMRRASNSFISSTFWSERSGPTAALETIKIMNKLKTWNLIKKKGKKIKKIWIKLSKKYNLDISINPSDSICSFKFNYENHNFLKSFLTYKMLKNGFLSNNVVMVSISHSDKIIKQYEKALDKTFKEISNLRKNNINNIKNIKPAFQGFYRMN